LQKLHGINRVGAGVVAYHNGREVFNNQLGLGSSAEVYDAEMAALMLGLNRAVSFTEQNPEITNLHFFSDNSAAIDAIFDPKPAACQLYAHNFNQKATKFLDNSPDSAHIEISWVPGHQGIRGNERADELAKGATHLSSSEPASRSNALRRAKAKVQNDWRKMWRTAPTRGQYAIANLSPPSLRTTRHFEDLKDQRELFGRLLQCRTGHNYSGEYYAKFVPSENINCPCGEPLQTREHILRECPRYTAHRQILRDTSPRLFLPTLLGSKEGIKATASFLERSGAFTKTGNPRPQPKPPDPPSDANPSQEGQDSPDEEEEDEEE
jgi:ribonuclease HI